MPNGRDECNITGLVPIYRQLSRPLSSGVLVLNLTVAAGGWLAASSPAERVLSGRAGRVTKFILGRPASASLSLRPSSASWPAAVHSSGRSRECATRLKCALLAAVAAAQGASERAVAPNGRTDATTPAERAEAPLVARSLALAIVVCPSRIRLPRAPVEARVLHPVPSRRRIHLSSGAHTRSTNSVARRPSAATRGPSEL